MLINKMDVLVIDDEPYILRSLEFVLRKEGLNVDTASNGKEALSKVKRLKPKIVFLDLMMPKLNGFEVCKSIKSDAELGQVHVIILTAKGQDEDRDLGLQAGADDFMTKPFSPREVVSKVRSILGRNQ
jgi:two-component system alkaline phosphatase synthesis response regulator PhoP